MTAPVRILIADTEPNGFQAISNDLELQFQCCFETVSSEDELITSMTEESLQILVIDFAFLIEKQGTSLLKSLKASYPNTSILPIIPTGDPQLIKQCFEIDLFYYIHRPFDPAEASIALKRVYEALPQEPHKNSTPVIGRKRKPFHGMIGNSEAMQRLFGLVTKVAEDDFSTVLIRGESGTGKEMVAKAIHAQSERRDKNFVPVNCAAIPDDLLESELFGYIKGAFTGATANKPGRIQYADKGTLFLDEIGDMKSSLQAKLLRVIQEKEFEPVGAFKSIPVNTRILAATHCDLEQLVKEGKFREDLYYRLSVIPLNIPSLKERAEDIPYLIDAFLEKYSENRGRERFTFSDEAFAAVAHYQWRGNVRELENLIQHMSILNSGQVIELKDLPETFHNVEVPDGYTPCFLDNDLDHQNHLPDSEEQVTSPEIQNLTWDSGQVDFKELINDFETQLIVQALKMTEGNKKEAAKLLKLKRTTLLEKIKKKGIEGLWEG